MGLIGSCPLMGLVASWPLMEVVLAASAALWWRGCRVSPSERPVVVGSSRTRQSDRPSVRRRRARTPAGRARRRRRRRDVAAGRRRRRRAARRSAAWRARTPRDATRPWSRSAEHDGQSWTSPPAGRRRRAGAPDRHRDTRRTGRRRWPRGAASRSARRGTAAARRAARTVAPPGDARATRATRTTRAAAAGLAQRTAARRSRWCARQMAAPGGWCSRIGWQAPAAVTLVYHCWDAAALRTSRLVPGMILNDNV